METWNTDVKALHELALKNLPVVLPSKFLPMSVVLGEIIGNDEVAQQLLPPVDPAEESMFVLSNVKTTYGASAILDKEVMKKITDIFSEVYIIPSSLHELIVLPCAPNMDADMLTSMIQEVNSTSVAAEDLLSDHPYKFNLKDGLISA